ncbi:hypothetical protein PIB30_083541 [Stylosanthes scabra]|uniref:Uncharacterized protein n=1 Tax=Stylosanthes scabra TaxID=79078 RepID=A0ABU6RT27_9FABA|nr:hypothetical protein [Stylosanthes scabra]
MLKMSGEAREASSHRMDKGHGGESFSANAGSNGSSVGGVLKKKKKFIAPLCSCGAYAILFEASTPSNPNRLSLGASIISDVANTAAVVDPMKRIEERID